jgi:hypothetical protein
MNDRGLAILNGREYAPGESIEPGGWIVRSIRPFQVVVSSPEGGAEMVVPLDEQH